MVIGEPDILGMGGKDMRTLIRATLPLVFLWCAGLSNMNPLEAQADVLTQRADNARSSLYLTESELNVSNVNKDLFGKLAYRLVDGNIYAQPLIVNGAKISGRSDQDGVNVAIVATEHNSVYAFDAEDTNQASTAAQLWHTGPNVLGTSVESTDISKAIGPGICNDLTTEVGITSTPAIALTKTTAPKQGVIFVVAKSKNGDQYQYKLFALSLADGAKISELAIQGEAKGSGIGSTGSGADAKIRFNPLIQLNRPGLLLLNDTLYVAFGGHCDKREYHGWVFAYDVSNPQEPKLLDVLCTTPNGKEASTKEGRGRGGIWMSGDGLVADQDGNIYFSTGDGTYNGTTDFGNSILKVKLVAGKFQLQDWYTPQNRDFLNFYDQDLGSGGPALVPNSHLLLAGGKEGRMYLIDRDDMGHGINLSRESFQVTHDPKPPKGFYNIHGAPVIWPREGQMFVYLMGEEDPLKQYRLIPDNGPGAAGWKFESHTRLHESHETAPYPNYPDGLFNLHLRDKVWMPGGFVALSANGNQDGSAVIWVNMPYASDANQKVVLGVLRAYDARDISRPELWDSEHTGNLNDRLGQFAKFVPPTIANGKVYVPAFQQENVDLMLVHSKMTDGDQPALVIYGLKPKP
jgi:hypothetical protein